MPFACPCISITYSTFSPVLQTLKYNPALNVFSINCPSLFLLRYTTLLVSFGVSLRDIPKSVCLNQLTLPVLCFHLYPLVATLTDNLIAAPSSTPTMLPGSSKVFTPSATEYIGTEKSIADDIATSPAPP